MLVNRKSNHARNVDRVSVLENASLQRDHALFSVSPYVPRDHAISVSSSLNY